MNEIDHSISPPIAVTATAPGSGAAAKDDFRGSTDAITAVERDADVAAYVVETRADFDRLRQAAGQLAGLLVLAMSGVKAITPEHTVLRSAKAAHAEAAAHLRLIRVPGQARHHHHHLLLGLELIGRALQQSGNDIAAYASSRRDVDDALRPLQSGYTHLQRAAALLPGFDIIAFSQGCCASHPAVAKPHPLQ